MAQDTNRSPPGRGRRKTPSSTVLPVAPTAGLDESGKSPAPSAPVGREPDRHASSTPIAVDSGHAVIPVVGIGASAGGLDAVSRFLAATPADSGAAYIVILHLDPTHESHLAPLLARHTTMPVVEIVDGMRIEANQVHVIVPDRSVTVAGDRLVLSEPIEARGHRRLVDAFFSSLAMERRERAIGIVLSGTGANGTRGLKEIKAQGGMTLAEDPDKAAFGGMPRSAIAANAIDHVVAIESMPAAVLRFIRHEYVAADAGKPGANRSAALDPLLALLLSAGHDFRGYKLGTVLRRIQRRMGLSNQASLATYADLLRADPAEMRALVKDMMITVTSFFRDPEAWQALDDQVIAPLIADRESGGELRFWVPACASGEEAYSLVMLATERADAAGKRFEMKIFATDSQEDNLAVARAGLYPEAATANLSPARLERFFDPIDGSYQIKKEFRERVVFAPQNLLRDPPFSRLDLITCRNLLIYLEPAAQKRVLALFHFALRDGGYLFLGSAETVGDVDELFETRSKKWRIYRGIGATPHNLLNFPVQRLVNRRGSAAPEEGANSVPEVQQSSRIAELARRALIDRYAPASVLADAKGRVLYFHGPTGDFLEPPSGEPTRDLVLLARDGLRVKLRGALRRALEQDETVVFDARVRQGSATQLVSVTVEPLIETKAPATLLLVSFARVTSAATTQPRTVTEDETLSERAIELELKAARAELQGTIEQAESANEELKSANEEVTSMNEELQSTNEELETSKEELQSFNEELHTTNHQLQHKIHELEGLTDDLNNLLAGSRIATVFLDVERRIKWFSPASQELFDLVATDVGRPLGHFALKFADPALLTDSEAVLATLQGREAEVRSDEGRWFLRKLLPYRTRDHRIGGLVITFVDISALKRAADAVEEERIYSQAIVETIGQPLLVLDAGLKVRSGNRAFYALFATAPDATEGRPLFELGAGHWDTPELRAALQASQSSDGIGSVTVDHEFQALGRRAMVVTTRRLARGGERPELILLAIDDVTARKDAELHRDLLVGELRHRVKNTLATVQALAWQTARNSPTMADFTKGFSERLQALAQVHDILVEEGWLGADISELMHRTLEPYRVGAPTRITIEGPRVAVTPASGVALVMIVQELVTNATKYGALSVPGGIVRLTWQIEQGVGESQIHLRWAEAGGPPVVEPTRRGFGTTFVERATVHELHGKAALQFRPGGLRCDIVFPRNEPLRRTPASPKPGSP
jgi:two-component system, chemotaxis family, CheB/CheR fusion protein